MELYSETLDPSETKDFAWDWTPKLASGEAVSSHVVAFIDAAGTTSPSDSVAANISRVWLTGGTVGSRAIWTITATTNQGRTFEQAVAVDIVDSVVGAEPATALERLQAHREKLLDAKDEAIGGTVTEVWNGRYGNKMKYVTMTYEQICDALARVDREIAAEQAAANGLRSRRPIAVMWNN